MISGEVEKEILGLKEQFPVRGSAILPALRMLQKEHGYLTQDGMHEVARLLEIPYSDVGGVASFYTMLFSRPTGKYTLDVCTTLSCSLLGAEHLVDYLSDKLGINVGETTPDGLFTIRTVQCLGDCGKAPVMMVGDRYYEDLTPEKLDSLLDELRRRVQG